MNARFVPKATLIEAVELLRTGDSDRAEAICREAVANNPRDVNMVALLGVLLFKGGRLEEAERYLHEAIRLAPTFAKPHEDLGLLLLESGRFEEAARYLRRATQLDPKLDIAFFSLGKALAALGRGEEADSAFEVSFDLNPERKTVALAAKHHREGRVELAERLCRQVLHHNAKNVNALRLLGAIAASAARYEEAERQFRHAVEAAPDFVVAIIDLGKVLKEQDRFKEAIECFRRAIVLQPDNVQAQFLLAGTLAPAALTYEAIEEYRRCLELRPNHAGALLGLGHVLKTVGRQEEAIEAYRQCANIKPGNGEIYWSLANLKTYRFTDEEIRDMESHIDGELEEQSHVNFLFALAKAWEDRGDTGRAWDYYRRGNELRRMQERYDPVQTEVINGAIRRVFTGQLLKEKSGGGCPDRAPIFVLGLPRSGSTLIEQILASHSRVEGTSELPYLGRVAASLNRNRADGINYPEAVRELGPEHFKTLGEDYLEYAALHRTGGKPHFIDKMPNNFPNIGLLHLILPNAKIIDARRHPLDACLGCYRQLFARGQTFTYDLTDIGEYYLQYQQMMDHWHEVLPGRVLTVQYEELVTDFENQVRRLTEYCELPWEDNCLHYYDTERPVRTASSEQVRLPIYTRSIDRWRRYEKHLGELIEILEPILPRYE